MKSVSAIPANASSVARMISMYFIVLLPPGSPPEPFIPRSNGDAADQHGARTFSPEIPAAAETSASLAPHAGGTTVTGVRRRYRAGMPQTPGDTPAYAPADVPPDAPASPAAPSDAGPARRMPPWLPKAFVLAGVVVLAFMAALWLLERLRGLLLLLLISLFLAFAIELP